MAKKRVGRPNKNLGGRPQEIDLKIRRAAVWLIGQGALDMSEIAIAFDVSRQLVRFWGMAAKIDRKAARERFLKEHRAKWRKLAMEYAREG